jgi:hypothetical protein
MTRFWPNTSLSNSPVPARDGGKAGQIPYDGWEKRPMLEGAYIVEYGQYLQWIFR